MSQLKNQVIAIVIILLGGCSSNVPLSDNYGSQTLSDPIAGELVNSGGTTLFVSLGDGSIIAQIIDVSADFCFKQNSATSTICFTKGDAIFDTRTNEFVGYEMIEDRIELIAKSD